MENLFERLGQDALESEYFGDLFYKISINYGNDVFASRKEPLSLSPKEFHDLLRFADVLSCSANADCRNRCFHAISLLYEEHKTSLLFQIVAKAVFSKLGNFPSIAYMEKRQLGETDLPFDRHLENALKEVVQAVPNRDNEVFTDVQYQLYKRLSVSKSFSFSGPTSMGKSFIIKAFVQSVLMNKPAENLIIMVPTRALINQFSLDLKAELRVALQEFNFKVITNSNVTELSNSQNHNYIFVLTPERVMSYLAEEANPPVGFLFVDEAHKIAARNDLRSITTYSAIQKTVQRYPNINLYFASPNVANPEVFLELFDRDLTKKFRTNESPVAQNRFFVDLIKKTVVQYIADEPTKIDGEILGDISDFNFFLQYLGSDTSNIVYCNSRSKTIERSRKYSNHLTSKLVEPNQVPDEIRKAIRQIKAYIHSDYYLAAFLELGIAYHYGNLPQIVRNIVEDLYRKGLVKNLFCTSTLLEGVNLPAKKIFILSSKKSKTQFSPIDFWNLAGRAGRLGKELSGDIYCVKDEEESWEKLDLIEKREEIQLSPTVSDRISKNLKKIEKLLLKQDISGTTQEVEILKYIANIICVDTMEITPGYNSPVIQQLVDSKKNEILELAKNRAKDLLAPLAILQSNHTIDLEIQNKVYNAVKRGPVESKLPTQINYEGCLNALQRLADLYEWEVTEPKLMRSAASLKYIALLTNQWINGISLRQIINEAINFQSKRTEDFFVNYRAVGRFDRENTDHVNELINTIIEDLEHKLRYTLEKYFNHYYLICKEVVGEAGAGANWARFLEYGTKNSIVIALQNLGLSRHAAGFIYKEHKDCLVIEGGKLRDILTETLTRRVDKESIEFEEIKSLL